MVEDLTEGVIALARLFGALATRDARALEGPATDVRLDGFREKVDAKLTEEVAPRLQELIRQYDRALPGISLVKAFGL